jgi:hypothetical protein
MLLESRAAKSDMEYCEWLALCRVCKMTLGLKAHLKSLQPQTTGLLRAIGNLPQ